MFFLYGLLAAVIVVAIATVPVLIAAGPKGSRYSRHDSARGLVLVIAGIALVVYTLVNLWVLWGALPALGFSWTAYSQMWGLWVVELLVLAAVLCFSAWDNAGGVGVIGAVLAVLMLVQGLGNMKVWTEGHANTLLDTIKVTEHAEVGDYPETDANHIVTVPIEVARQQADVAMRPEFNTYYNPAEPALQNIDGHLYWVAMLEPDGFWNSNIKQGLAPGFMVIDAENPGQPARYIDKNADGTPVVIAYQPKGYFEHKLTRHVRTHGYANEALGEWTLELDDNWRPFYTASIDVLPTSAFTGTVPSKTISVDAQTGDIKVYDLDKTPSWIDRIYSAKTVKEMLNWWGEWKKAGFAAFYVSRGDRFTVAEGQEPTLVYTKSGHPEWQVQLSATNNKEAASHVALFSGRDNQVDVYSIPSLQLESSAARTVFGSAQNTRKNVPTHISLHRIYGQLTWVMPLISPKEGSDENKPEPSDRSAFQGLALMKAEGSSGSDVAMDTTVGGALAEYRNDVLRGGSTKPSEDSTLKTVKGTVTHLSPPMAEGGLNVFYFRLDTEKRTYKMSVDPNDAGQTVERPFIKVGAQVNITYRDSGDAKGDVVDYDDLGM